MQPAAGGNDPATNPQVAFASLDGGTDAVPSFLRANGPVREARFVKNPDGSPDGGVHAIFTITGRTGATGCTLAQPNFAAQLANNNVIFRIPTPAFGTGLMEQIPDAAIAANQASNSTPKSSLGIRGRPNFAVSGRAISGQTNNNGNDGTIARFGWKAQNKSLLLFSGEAYNVEMGITNELFQTERDETANCQFATVPNDVQNTDATTALEATMAIRTSNFMRFLAPPAPSTDTPGGATSITNGEAVQRHRLRVLPHALVHDGQLHRRRALQQAGEPVLGPAGAQHGAGACRRHQPRSGGAGRVPQRATVGSGPAYFLPA
jgi:hypothetical protein